MKNNREFIWGCATSSYQIEGAWNEDGKGPSIWDSFCDLPGRVANGDTGRVACDHYHRYPEDVALMKGLGVDAYRFSVSWPRILPEGKGAINRAGIDFYSRLVDELLESGIEPWATLYHWDLPQALEDKGGWANRDIVGWFDDYATIFAKTMGDRVRNYFVLNEPSVTSYHGYVSGIFAPGLKSIDGFIKATHHQNLVHGQVIRSLRQLDSRNNAGSAYTHFPVRPQNPDRKEDIKAASIIHAAWSGNFLDPAIHGRYPEVSRSLFEPVIRDGDMELIRERADFVGVNHYHPYYAVSSSSCLLGADLAPGPDNSRRTDIGWPYDPPAFTETLADLRDNYGNPVVIITENGVCDNAGIGSDGLINDSLRVDYYRDYIAAMKAAMSEGCNVGGYFAWSFMDNFEWALGYGKRFGLVYMDYETLKRTPKSSYHWYKDMIAAEKRNRGLSGKRVSKG